MPAARSLFGSVCRIAVFSVGVLLLTAGAADLRQTADASAAEGQSPGIGNVAGNGKAGPLSLDGKATAVAVAQPFGVVTGPDGALYICEVGQHRVLRLDRKTGTLTAVAGTGKQGYSGDGGPATSAELNEPYEVRFDADGNMFFVEMKNQIVRRVDAKTGVISTVAGTGKKGFSGDGGPATKATLSSPHSIALDASGHLYICDIGNHRIRRVHLASGTISTFAGTGERKPTPDGAKLAGTPLNGPRALDFDGEHSLYLALREGNAVYRIDLERETLHHIAGTGKSGYSGHGGDARQAELSGPKGLALDAAGNIFLADTESHTIRVILKQDGTIHTVAGNGKPGDGPEGQPLTCRMNRPHGVHVDAAGRLYVGDSSAHRVRELTPAIPAQLAVAEGKPASTGHPVAWQRLKLDEAFRSEGVAAADVNHDGKMDVLAGDVWYAAPDWTMHEIRPVGQFVAGKGYSNSFANWAYDVNGDGWDDFLLIGFPGDPFYWYENPKNAEGHWKQHVIWHSACNESPDFVDLTGDGQPEFVLGSQPESQMGYLPIHERPTEKWTFNAISRPGNPMENGTFKYYHGLGTGDFNGDGRSDVLIAHGWWEAPAEPGRATWEFHPWSLSLKPDGPPEKGADIFIEDLDLDGDNDLIMSSAHSYGIWWFENLGPAKPNATGASPQDADAGSTGRLQFKAHVIDEEYSQTHAVEYVDINGDGQRDIVTGKRFFAHNGNDPGGKEPVVMFWYEFRRTKGKPPVFLRHEIEAGRGTGIGTQFLVTDMNGDKRPDVVLSNKKGVNVLLQTDAAE